MKFQTIKTEEILALLFFSLYCCFGLSKWKSTKAVDFYQFWVIGQAVQQMGIANVFESYESTRINRTFHKKTIEEGSSEHQEAVADRKKLIQNNTPFLYALFKFFSSGDFDIDYERYRIFSILIYMVSLYGLCRLLGYNPFLALAFLVMFTQMFWPFRRDITLGNVTQIQFGLMVLFIWVGHRAPDRLKCYLEGFVLGISIFFKPTILFAVALVSLRWIAERDLGKWFRICVGGALAALVAFALPHFILGSACTWKNWISGVSRLSFTKVWIDDSLPALLFGTLDLQIHWILGLMMTGGVFFAYARTHLYNRLVFFRRLGDASPLSHLKNLLLYCLGVAIYFLSAPLVHGQYILMIIPLFLLMFGFNGQLKWPENFPKWISLGALIITVTHPVEKWHFSLNHINQLWNYAAVALVSLCGIYTILSLKTKKSSLQCNI